MKFPKPKNAKDWQQVYNAIKNASEKDFPDADPAKFNELKRTLQTMWVGPVLLWVGVIPLFVLVLLGGGGLIPLLWFFAWSITGTIISVTKRKKYNNCAKKLACLKRK